MIKRLCAVGLALLIPIAAAAQQGVAVLVRNGTTDPALCSASSTNIFLHRTGATTADKLEYCSATNVWTALGSGTVTSVGNGTIGSLFTASWATPTTTPALSFNFAALTANTVLANATAGAAVPTAFAMPSCSTSASALIWTTSTGFGCNTGIAAATVTYPLAGTPTAPTAVVDTNTTQIATTAYYIAQAAAANPIIDGTAAPGTSTRFARADHVHPTDTTRVSVSGNQSINGNLRTGSSSAPGTVLHAGIGDTSTTPAEVRVDSGSGANAYSAFGMSRNGVNKSYISTVGATDQFIPGSAIDDLTIRSQKILFSADNGTTADATLTHSSGFTCATACITPLFRSTAAKVLIQGTGTGATQFAATQTTAPTCSSNCGTSPSVTGTDTAGIVTMGGTGSPASGWIVTFNGTWAAAPACVVQSALAGMLVTKMPIVVATTTTTFTVTTNGAAPANSDKYSFHCLGTQ